MRGFSPAARTLLALVLAEGFLHSLAPNLTQKSYLLMSEAAARHPLTYAAALPLVSVAIMVLVSLLCLESKLVFVGGIVLAAAGIVAQQWSQEYWSFAFAQQATAGGSGLFGAAAFVLEARWFPRRWLFLGPFAYAILFWLGGWITPYLLGSWVGVSQRGFVCGGFLVILALVATSQLLTVNEPEDQESSVMTLANRGRLMLLAGLLAVSLVFPGVPVPERYWPHLGMIGPFDPWRVLGIVLGQVFPLAIGGVLIARWRSVGFGVRALSALILALVTVGWAVPAIRSSVRTLTDPLYSWALALVAIAIARGTRGPQRLRSTLAVQIAPSIAGLVAYYAVVSAAWRDWRPGDPAPLNVWPIGLTVSLFALLGMGLYLLLVSGSAPASPEGRSAEPSSSESA